MPLENGTGLDGFVQGIDVGGESECELTPIWLQRSPQLENILCTAEAKSATEDLLPRDHWFKDSRSMAEQSSAAGDLLEEVEPGQWKVKRREEKWRSATKMVEHEEGLLRKISAVCAPEGVESRGNNGAGSCTPMGLDIHSATDVLGLSWSRENCQHTGSSGIEADMLEHMLRFGDVVVASSDAPAILSSSSGVQESMSVSSSSSPPNPEKMSGAEHPVDLQSALRLAQSRARHAEEALTAVELACCQLMEAAIRIEQESSLELAHVQGMLPCTWVGSIGACEEAEKREQSPAKPAGDWCMEGALGTRSGAEEDGSGSRGGGGWNGGTRGIVGDHDLPRSTAECLHRMLMYAQRLREQRAEAICTIRVLDAVIFPKLPFPIRARWRRRKLGVSGAERRGLWHCQMADVLANRASQGELTVQLGGSTSAECPRHLSDVDGRAEMEKWTSLYPRDVRVLVQQLRDAERNVADAMQQVRRETAARMELERVFARTSMELRNCQWQCQTTQQKLEEAESTCMVLSKENMELRKKVEWMSSILPTTEAARPKVFERSATAITESQHRMQDAASACHSQGPFSVLSSGPGAASRFLSSLSELVFGLISTGEAAWLLCSAKYWFWDSLSASWELLSRLCLGEESQLIACRQDNSLVQPAVEDQHKETDPKVTSSDTNRCNLNPSESISWEMGSRWEEMVERVKDCERGTSGSGDPGTMGYLKDQSFHIDSGMDHPIDQSFHDFGIGRHEDHPPKGLGVGGTDSSDIDEPWEFVLMIHAVFIVQEALA